MQAINNKQRQEEKEEKQQQSPPSIIITRQTTPIAFALTSIRSIYTKKQYPGRLKAFFNYIGLPGNSLEEQAQAFLAQARKGMDNNNQYWTEDTILFFLEFQKQRIDREEITAGTLVNFYSVIKTFCDAYKRELQDIDWI